MDTVADAASQKRVLRRSMRQRRRCVAADPQDLARRSRRIWTSVVELLDAHLAMYQHPAVMLFQSTPTEPDTTSWFAGAGARGWRVHVPLVDGSALRVEPGDADPRTLHAVVFPGLAFTSDGARLGQGGGHYDRFALRLDAGCLRIGVCFAEQLVDRLPTEPHDQRVDVVVTDISRFG